MKDYYDLFVELSLQQCATREDYMDKSKVKKHNSSFTKFIKLENQMKQIDCVDILSNLLNHKDERVTTNAAALCLKMHILTEQAIITLKRIAETPSDPIIGFSAEMLLKVNNIN